MDMKFTMEHYTSMGGVSIPPSGQTAGRNYGGRGCGGGGGGGRGGRNGRGGGGRRGGGHFSAKTSFASKAKKDPLLGQKREHPLDEDYKNAIRNVSYIGKKGYTIPKTALTKEDDAFLRKDLFMKPDTPAIFAGGISDASVSFPVYRENSAKLYIPRFYGIERYGFPSSHPQPCRLDEGDDVFGVDFPKSLRDYQVGIVKTYLDYVKDTPKGAGGAILEVPCARGKCLGKNTPILMWDGTIKPVQEIKVGDQLMGDNSTPRRVISLAYGREKMYKICICDGKRKDENGANGKSEEKEDMEGYIVNKSHILSLYRPSHGDTFDIPLTEYVRLDKWDKHELYGYRVSIDFPKIDIPDICDNNDNDNDNDTVPYYFNDRSRETFTSFGEKLTRNMENRIPYCYRCNSAEIRFKILSGINNAIGFYCDTETEFLKTEEEQKWLNLHTEEWKREFTEKINSFGLVKFTAESKYRDFIEDVKFMVRSLGMGVEENATDNGKIVRLYINGFNLKYLYFRYVPVTKNTEYSPIKSTYKFTIKSLGEDEYFGFELGGNRRFVLGDTTVTHNTVMALNIISSLKKKTLILVHKEFLMNQWIERIGEFLPNATVGKIQAQKIDIDGKDIVIGMIQSLYDKEHAEDTFSSFGLTIIDEVHRIGSEQFSRTLLKIITPYMLGISATVERKDGLTKILNMFIGPKIYSEEREHDDPVCVRSIRYMSNNAEFCETEYDRRGTPMYSKMIVKLCDFHPRTEFILRVIKDMREENPQNQIMVLAHNRSILTYLHDAIEHRGIATVGYYVGGMKQCELTKTETKEVVIATYAMAAEALDIKTLASLILATPKTDVIQSVGRILRVKHERPIIVDIIDTHDIFQNQWVQRMKFYKKCNYRIRQISSSQYQTMNLNWETDKTWKRMFEPKTAPAFASASASAATHHGAGSALSLGGHGKYPPVLCENNSDTDTDTAEKRCLINIKDIDFTEEINL